MNDSRFIELCVSVLDGTASADDVGCWNERIVNDPQQRRIFRDLCAQMVALEEECSSGVGVIVAPPPRRVAVVRWVAAAALLLIGAWVWRAWDNANDRMGSARPGIDGAIRNDGSAPPSAFVYPFDGFPMLQPESAEAESFADLRVAALDEIDPRIVAIVQRFAGIASPGELNF